MDVDVVVPQTPIRLAPGAETRIRVEVRNRSAAAMPLRLSVGHSRAAAWAYADPAVVELGDDDHAVSDLVFRPPDNTAPSATLLPFTVEAEDLRYGVPAGRATGLVTIAPPERLTVTLGRDPAGPDTAYELRLVNRSDRGLTVRIETRLDQPRGAASVEPPVVDLPAGGAGTARVRVHPHRPAMGPEIPYTVSAACYDAGLDDAPPLARESASGAAQPRVGTARALLAVALMAAALVAAAAALALAGRGPSGDGGPPAGTGEAAVSEHYVVFYGVPSANRGGREEAEQLLEKLRADGVDGARIVNSRDSARLVDGHWVLLRDGFPSAAAARDFCASVPKRVACTVGEP